MVSSAQMGRLRRQVMEVVLLLLMLVGALVWRGCDHELEALLGGWQLGDVVVGMGATDVFLHGAVSFFLLSWGQILDRY
jgi:hypothetical protein